MTLDAALLAVKDHKNGQFFWIDIQTNKSSGLSASARRAGHTCYKFTHVQVRKGINYENIKSVKDKRSAGIAQGTSWGTTSSNPDEDTNFVVYHNGKTYLKFFPVGATNAINEKQVKYFLDGEEKTLTELENSGLFTPSGLKDLSHEYNEEIKVYIDNVVNIY